MNASRGQAAGGYVEYDSRDPGAYSLDPRRGQASAPEPTSGRSIYAPGRSEASALGALQGQSQEKVTHRVRKPGAGAGRLA